MNEPPMSRPEPEDGKGADWTRSRGGFVRSLVGQALAVVLLGHAILLPWVYLGWLAPLQFALGALAFCCLGIAILSSRLAHALTDLHAVLLRFGAEPAQTPPRRTTWRRSLKRLTRGRQCAHR